MSRHVSGRNRRAVGFNVTPFVGAARSAASGDSAILDTASHNEIVLTLHVTAHSGTSPTLDVNVQTSDDGSTWTTVDSFTQVTTTNGDSGPKVFNKLQAQTKVHFAIGGSASPSYSFSVDGYVK